MTVKNVRDSATLGEKVLQKIKLPDVRVEEDNICILVVTPICECKCLVKVGVYL